MWLADATIQLIYQFRDDDDAMGRHTIYLPVASSSSAAAVAVGYMALLSAISDCAVVRCNVTLSYHTTTPAARGAGLGDRHDVGVFIFATDNEPSGLYVMTVPGIKTSTLLTTGPYAGVGIDPSNPAVAALVVATTSGALRPVAPWNPGAAPGAGDDLSWSGAHLLSLQAAYRGLI